MIGSACTDKSWQIEGRLDGNVNGCYVYLQYADTSRSLVDSALITDQNFTLKGKAEGVRLGSLYVGKTSKQRIGRVSLPLFVEAGQIRIQGDYDKLQASRQIFEYYIVSGTPANQVLMDYMEECRHFDRADQLVFDEYGDYLMNKQGDHSRAYFEKGLSLTRKIDSLSEARLSYSMACIRQYADSEVGLYIFSRVLSSLSLQQLEEMSALFPESLKQSAVGKWTMRQAEQAGCCAVGAMFTDFTLTTPQGEASRLSDYIGKGEYVLLECWASWCGPCKRDIPHVKQVVEKYGSKGFRVVGISMDTDREAWKKAIEEYRISWVQLSNLQGFAGALPRTYRIRGIPTCILLDPEGRIILRNARGSWLDRWLIGKFGDLF